MSGSVSLDGEDLIGRAAHDIVEAGIALVPEGRGVFAETRGLTLDRGGRPFPLVFSWGRTGKSARS